MTWWMWLLAALLLGIIEVLSITFVFLMFAIGAVAAAITAFFGGGLIAQVVVFVVVSLLLLIVMRPLMKGRIQRSGDDVRTNADALIGDATRGGTRWSHSILRRRMERTEHRRAYPRGYSN